MHACFPPLLANTSRGLQVPERVTGADVPMPYAADLEKAALPTVDDIIKVAKRVCYRDASIAA